MRWKVSRRPGKVCTDEDEEYDIICKQPSILFDGDEFCEIPESILVHFLRRDDLDLPEIFIWRRLLEWGIAQNHKLTRRVILAAGRRHQCLRHVRYHTFQPQEFCETD